MRPFLLLTLLCLAALTSVLRAQSTNASLTGRVTDPARAVVVGAKVAAISASTNVWYETTTNATGGYSMRIFRPASIASRSKKPISKS